MRGVETFQTYFFAIAIGTPVPLLLGFSLAGYPHRHHSSVWAMLAWFAFPAFIAGLNFYLSFIRGWLWIRRTGGIDGYRYASGFPLIGSIGTLMAACGTWGDAASASLGLVLCLLDTGGGTWFLIQCVRTHAFTASPLTSQDTTSVLEHVASSLPTPSDTSPPSSPPPPKSHAPAPPPP